MYSEYFAALVDQQAQRKASIEQRGLAVITTSGVIITLLFGLVALITDDKSFVLPRQAHGPLGLALAFFVLAAALGILTNLPLGYTNVDPNSFDAVFDRYWSEPRSSGELRLAVTRGRIFRRAQAVNTFKAWVLVAAMASELGAAICVGLAVREVLRAA